MSIVKFGNLRNDCNQRLGNDLGVSLEGDLLLAWRKYFGLTLEQLGELCQEEKGRSHVKDIESGRNRAGLETLLNLIGGLERSPRGFSFGHDDGMRLSRFFLGPARSDEQAAFVGAARGVARQFRGSRR